MSSKKGRKKRESRKAIKPDAKSQKKGVSKPKEPPVSKKTQSVKSNHTGEIRRLISKGKIKSAVNRAKQIHKVMGTEESESILVEAYIARILEMTEKGLTVEAKTLLDMVRKRYHFPDQRLAEIKAVTAVQGGVTDAFLAPLNDPSTPPEQQAAILNILKEKVVNLNALTSCKTLSPDHPLKVQAAAISKTFEAVTSGPVHEKEIALPGISRRSPLAPWKMLIKALFFFYCRNDTLCERFLQAVEAGSAPSRLVPAIRAMVREKGCVNPDKNTHVLMEQVTGNRKGIQKKLHDLESALAVQKVTKLYPEIRGAVNLCERFQPELVERLKQQTSIRSWMIDANAKLVQKAMGGPSLKNAYFWKLFARAAEIKGEHFWACAMWDEFMKHAVHEKIFPANGLESSVVYLHMANLLSGMASPDFDWDRSQFEHNFTQSKGLASYYKGQPGFIFEAIGKNRKVNRQPDFLYPERLYKRACEIDPSSEAFSNWLEWMENSNFKKKILEKVALSWRESIPHDITPVLYLAKLAEKRNAFKKCLTYLNESEQIDSLHPDIKKIRLRIWAATAIRHLKQKKPHLAKNDFKEMETLPLFKSGDRPAFLTALKWVCALIEGPESESQRLNKELIKRMGSQLSATIILRELLKACGLPENVSGVSFSSLKRLQVEDLLFAVGRACLLGDDVGMPVAIPPMYTAELENVFTSEPTVLDASMMGAVAEAALRNDCMELAYAVSGAGLLKGAPTSAVFLLLRARSLPVREQSRKNSCIDAAIVLARRERDMDLIDEAIELRRNEEVGGYFSLFRRKRRTIDDFSTDPEALDDLLKREREAREYPHDASEPDFPDFDDDDDDDDLDGHDCRHCSVEDCPSRKVEYVPGSDDDDWEDDDSWGEDDRELLEAMLEGGSLDLPSDIPPEAVPILLKIMLKYGNKNGDLPELDEVFKKDPALIGELFEMMPDDQSFFEPGEKKKKKKRKGKR